jgi:hypothetical protein
MVDPYKVDPYKVDHLDFAEGHSYSHQEVVDMVVVLLDF